MFPLPLKVRRYQGPHTSCLMTANSYILVSSHKGRTLEDNHYHRTLVYNHVRSILNFTSGLLSMMFFASVGTAFIIGYILTKIFLRFQYKLTLFLIFLDRQPFELKLMNDISIFCLHVMLILMGGFGSLAMFFVEV
ncbi:transmembrane protein 250 [Patella vulgata]|uniref:transmembrane protein 250 n=1 Tax=Patella vulgata TaxID=6465 RepID=UPI0021801E8B|nr:transmembrane protein 250 [Patella vulgata]